MSRQLNTADIPKNITKRWSVITRKSDETSFGDILLLLAFNSYQMTDKYFYYADTSVSRGISQTSASVSSGIPNTRKLMKARGRRPSAFIAFECLEIPMKHEARVFEIVSQSCISNQEQ